MQEQNNECKIKSIKYALSILNADHIYLSDEYLETYFKKNNIIMSKGPVLHKKKENCNEFIGRRTKE